MKKISIILGLAFSMLATGGVSAQTSQLQQAESALIKTVQNIAARLKEKSYPAVDKSGEKYEQVCNYDTKTGQCVEYFLRKTCTAPAGGGSCNAILVWGSKTAVCTAENESSCTSRITLTADEWKKLKLPTQVAI